jgi:hypothetical protein
MLPAAGAAEVRLSQKQELMRRLKEEYVYDPALSKPPEVTSTAPDVVLLDRLVVEEKRMPRGLPQHMEKRRQELRDEKFSFTKGGTLIKTNIVTIGAWGAANGINFIQMGGLRPPDERSVIGFGYRHGRR